MAVVPFVASRGWANPPYRIIVSFPPGGSSDTVVRSFVDRLSMMLGEPVIVENRPGAAGNIAIDHAVRSAPDGRTMLLAGPGQLTVNPLLYSNLQHQPLEALTPVSMVGEMEHVITLTNAFPATTLAEYVAYGKTNPEEITYGSSGIGTTTHLCGALFALRADVKLRHIAYKGAGQAMNDLVAGHIHTLYDLLPSSLGSINTGTIRPLATTGKVRGPHLPHVPTVSESGFPEFAATSWHALMAPAATPPETLARINAALAEALKDAQVRERLDRQGVKLIPMSPTDSMAFLRADARRWQEVVTGAGITLQNS